MSHRISEGLDKHRKKITTDC